MVCRCLLVRSDAGFDGERAAVFQKANPWYRHCCWTVPCAWGFSCPARGYCFDEIDEDDTAAGMALVCLQLLTMKTRLGHVSIVHLLQAGQERGTVLSRAGARQGGEHHVAHL